MEFKKKTTVEGNFVKKGEDIKNGDMVDIADTGREVEGQYGMQNIFKIKTKNGEFLMSFNQTSINAIIDEFGNESTNWVGKQVKVHSIKQNVSGKFIDVYYVAPDGYEMGENGFEKVDNRGANEYDQNDNQSQHPEIPPYKEPQEEDINVKQIPF